MHRRSFVKASAGAMLGPALMTGMAGCEQRSMLAPIGLQLSTVTRLMLADFNGTLERVASIGYRQVEFSAMGLLGQPVADVKKLLAKLGLAAPVGRVSPRLPADAMERSPADIRRVYRERTQPEYFLDNVTYSLETALALGQTALVLPVLMPDNFASLDQVKTNVERINRAGELCAQQGVTFGYHNHNWEFLPLEGVIPYDFLLEQTAAQNVTFQLDVYWLTKAGGDFTDYFSRYPGRFSTCHLKDIDAAGDFADVGDGLIDMPRFVREAIAQGAQHFFVERDNPPQPAESIERSFGYLQQMRY